MKRVTILSSAILITGAAGAGWWQRQRLESLRGKHAGLLTEAARLGVAVLPSAAAPAPVSPEKESADREAEAQAVAAKFIQVAKSSGPNDPAMAALLFSLLESVAAFDEPQWLAFTAAVRKAGEAEQNSHEDLLAFAFVNLASRNPRGALSLFPTLAAGFPDEEARTALKNMVFTRALATWAKSDPRAAAAWIGETGEGSHYREQLPPEVTQTLLAGAALSDPRAAFALIRDLPGSDPRKAVSAITRAATTPSLRAAALAGLREYLPTVENEAQRKTLADTGMRNLAQGLTRENPAEAGEWLASAGLDAGEQEAIASAVSSNYRGEEPGPWLEWMAATLPADSSAEKVRRLLTAWTERDHEAAAAWLTALPAGPARESAVSVFAETVAPYEPEAAAQWALTLPPGPARQATLQEIHDAWPRKDPASTAAAEAFARENGLPPL